VDGVSLPGMEGVDWCQHAIGGRRVVVAPGLTVRLGELPPFSIALDGVVQGPEIDTAAHRLSFDHHGDCVRLATAATCRQVADALLLGLDPGPYTVYVNDVDADTVLATALLARPDLLGAGSASVPAARALVEAVGGRDAHGPAYPVSDPTLLAAFAARVPIPPRRVGGTARQMAAAMADCVAAIVDLVAELASAPSASAFAASVPSAEAGGPAAAAGGHGAEAGDGDGDGDGRDSDRTPAGAAVPGHGAGADVGRDAEYTVTHRGSGWVMVQTSAVSAFERVYADGHTRVVLWGELSDGSTAYTVARRSDLVDFFPVGPADRDGTILAALAAREPGWGGGSSIGGAPRHPGGRRSSLHPDEVFSLVEAVVTGAA
jgi:hypothetical protein